MKVLGQYPITTLLVSPGAEGLGLLGVQQPENEILEEPEQHLAMHGRQRANALTEGGKDLVGRQWEGQAVHARRKL